MVDTKYQLLCAKSAYLMMVVFGVGLVPLAQFIPPVKPSLNAADVVAIYHARPDMIMAGSVFLMMAAVLYLPFFAAIGMQMARIEGKRPVLASAQMLIGVTTSMMAMIPALFYATGAFRVDQQDPNITWLMNDLGFMTLLWPFAPAFFQNLTITFCILSDKNPQPLFPRWVGFLNLWVAILYLPGALIPFFKTGPFAWTGIVAFWIPVYAFFIWIIVMAIYLVKAIKRPETD